MTHGQRTHEFHHLICQKVTALEIPPGTWLRHICFAHAYPSQLPRLQCHPSSQSQYNNFRRILLIIYSPHLTLLASIHKSLSSEAAMVQRYLHGAHHGSPQILIPPGMVCDKASDIPPLPAIHLDTLNTPQCRFLSDPFIRHLSDIYATLIRSSYPKEISNALSHLMCHMFTPSI